MHLPELMTLTTTDHSRDSAGMTYVYPVISRRSGGLSIGINLNPNNACNWRCIYCQVPDLVRGSAPPIDLELLDAELRQLLDALADGSFPLRFNTEAGLDSVRDFAISGNGESTSASEFGEVIDRIGAVRRNYPQTAQSHIVLITNGSLINKPTIQAGLQRLRQLGGEVWFKLDSATRAGLERINHAAISPERVRNNLMLSARLCPTWIQSCFFKRNGQPPATAEVDAYLEFIGDLLNHRIALSGVQLYGIERPSMQPEAAELEKLEAEWFTTLAARLRELGLHVIVKN